jgi:hypothetical protein
MPMARGRRGDVEELCAACRYRGEAGSDCLDTIGNGFKV